MSAEHSPETDYHKNPTAIFYYGTKLRLVVNLQTNVKAMQSEAYARKVKMTNLQQMANTLIYIQEHGYDTRKDLTAATSEAHKNLNDVQKRLRDLNAEMKTLNAQIHYTGQYFASKTVYAEFLKASLLSQFLKFSKTQTVFFSSFLISDKLFMVFSCLLYIFSRISHNIILHQPSFFS